MKILVTGASGFVGQSLCRQLVTHDHTYATIQRDVLDSESYPHSYDCLVHLAGRAHVMHETADDIYQAYREVNVDYTLKIAALAKSIGIRRFIFLSSVKVNGDRSALPFHENDTSHSEDSYGHTKLEAEIFLKDFCAANQMELVVIRPPLIYGPGVKANFKSLIQLCRKPIPLPFGRILNKRSLISLENLNSFIELCCHHPQAANQTFLISDDHDVSTTELINTIRVGLGRNPYQLPIPEKLLSIAFDMVGKHALNERLLGNLQVDITKAKELLGWRPVISFEEGIHRTVAEYVI